MLSIFTNTLSIITNMLSIITNMLSIINQLEGTLISSILASKTTTLTTQVI